MRGPAEPSLTSAQELAIINQIQMIQERGSSSKDWQDAAALTSIW